MTSALLSSPSASAPFEFQVDGIPIVQDGSPLAKPWLGGFMSPRPEFLDYDDDGDLDLFILQAGAGITLYANIGTSQNYDFVLAADPVPGIDAQAWFTFADIDADGDPDLFTDSNGAVRLFRNHGERGAPDWRLEDSRFQDILNLGAQNNAPIFVDIDNDQDFDYLEMQQLTGSARLYRNLGSPTAPQFEFETDAYGCIDTFDVGKKHGISSIASVDADGDSDPDVFVGDQTNPSLWYFRLDDNDTPCYSLISRSYLAVQTVGVKQTTFADIDGDDDQDLIMGGVLANGDRNNLMLFENVGTPATPKHELSTTPLISTLDLGINSTPCFADIDGDDDLDLIVGNDEGTLELLRNSGSRSTPRFVVEGPLLDESKSVIDLGRLSAPSLIDLDGDHDLDLVVGDETGVLALFRNRGTPEFPSFSLEQDTLAGVVGDFQAIPTAGDIDGDGNIEIMFGEFGTDPSNKIARLFILEEVSPGSWEMVSDNTSATFVFAEPVARSELAPCLVDVDNDGDADLFLGEQEGNINFYRNESCAEVPIAFELESEAFALADVGRFAAPAVADIDGDSDLDLVTGTRYGGLRFYRNVENASLTPGPQVSVTVYPNPANPSVRFDFILRRSGRVTMRMFDVRGRLVRDVVDDEYPACPLEFEWDGLDDDGRPVASGVFFYDLIGPGLRAGGRVTILR